MTVLQSLTGQHVLVLGLGTSGLAMVRWCVRSGATVTVADTRTSPPNLAVVTAELPQVRFVHSALDESLLEGVGISLVLKSPGLSPTEVAPVLRAAQAQSITIMGELGLFSQALAELKAVENYTPSVLAVTGTNGKTTVTALTGQLVARSGKTVSVAGNIGPSLLDTLAQGIDSKSLPQVWVIELSSFQLDGVTGFEPAAASVLNISQDHLDWHGSMGEYVAAKARIFGDSTRMVLNRDEPHVLSMLPVPMKGRVARHWTSFGSDMPDRPGDFGLEQVNGMVWLVRALEADETLKKKKNADEEIYIQRLIPADALRIRGQHNAMNALSALALACAAGCALAPMLYGLREYRGEPHRLESVAVIEGVEFFDDSKGTNVGATVAALQGLGVDRKMVVLLGGEGKGQDFSPLAEPVARFARAVILIGKDADAIRSALAESGIQMIDVASMSEAVETAFAQAVSGDAVLMSPACASFDMFDNYGHRGRVFCESVRALADRKGVMLEAAA